MNKTALAFKELFAAAKSSFEYFLEGAKLSFMESVSIRMKELNVSKSLLAQKLDCKPSYVTKILKGSANFTLESMVKIGLALDSEVEINLRAKKNNEDWSGILQPPQIASKRYQNPLTQWPNTRLKSLNFRQTTRTFYNNDTAQPRMLIADTTSEPRFY